MEVIIMESEAYKELNERIKNIERFVIEAGRQKDDLDTMWVDSVAVCQYLQVSERTLQRLRSKHMIAYSLLGGKSYYTLGEIKRALARHVIKRNEDRLTDLIAQYKKNLHKAFQKR